LMTCSSPVACSAMIDQKSDLWGRKRKLR